MTPANPKTPTKAGKRARARRRPRASRAPESTLDLLDRLLLIPRPMTLNGEKMKLPTIKVILLQLLQKEMAGNRRARSTLLKYREFAGQTNAQKFELRFIKSEAAEASSEIGSGKGDG